MTGVLVLVRARTHDVPKTLWTDGSIAALAVTAVSAAIVFETAFDASRASRCRSPRRSPTRSPTSS